MDYSDIQTIAHGVIEASAACDGQLFTGTVTNANPLKITLGEDAGGIELDGDDIILTQAVVSKKLYIKKHNHTEDVNLTDSQGTYVTPAGTPANVLFFPMGEIPPEEIDNPNPPPSKIPNPAYPTDPTKLALNHSHSIHTSTLDAWVTEYGTRLPVDPSTYDQGGEQTVITINRGLEKGDKVIMTRVSHGQQFIVLSRYFEVDKQGEDDN